MLPSPKRRHELARTMCHTVVQFWFFIRFRRLWSCGILSIVQPCASVCCVQLLVWDRSVRHPIRLSNIQTPGTSKGRRECYRSNASISLPRKSSNNLWQAAWGFHTLSDVAFVDLSIVPFGVLGKVYMIKSSVLLDCTDQVTMMSSSFQSSHAEPKIGIHITRFWRKSGHLGSRFELV